jgi:hypothetical protein
MLIFHDRHQLRDHVRSVGGEVALVPTMGNLHAGHEALMRRAGELAPHVVVSIFVNPTQFGPTEDFATYPRTEAEDLERCRAQGVHAVFLPDVVDLYPDGIPGTVRIGLPQLENDLCGAALMGGAVFASLDGETNFAAAPERVEMGLRGAIGGLAGRLTGIRKTDRLATISEPSVARQIMRVPTITRVRDRELVRTRSFVRVSGNLSLALSELSANIPPFNPQKLLTDGVANSDDAPAAAEPDAEVSFVTCDMVSSGPKNKINAGVCELNSL